MKEASVALFNVLVPHLLQGAEDNHEAPQDIGTGNFRNAGRKCYCRNQICSYIFVAEWVGACSMHAETEACVAC